MCSVVFLPGVIKQCVHQTSLAHFAFADQDEFGFIEGELCFDFCAQVGLDGIKTLFVGCDEFRVERV